MTEDWTVLLSFFPRNWAQLAVENDALKGLRKDRSVDDYLRTLLIHLACGYSLRETVVRARQAELADISDAALLGRLRKAKEWLRAMCIALFEEQGIAARDCGGFQVRLFDATTVKEPGPTGSLWRVHYSVRLPSLACDFFNITESKGKGTGESFFRYSIKKGDYIIADRGYSTASGVHHVASKKAYSMVRVNTKSLRILDARGQPFPLLERVSLLERPGIARSWAVQIPSPTNAALAGRICAVRKTQEAIELAQQKLRQNASKKQSKLQPETLEFAKYVIIFTTFPSKEFSDVDILEWYRSRWQVELVFKRFKSIAGLGHLPKRGGDSSKAWLYGKLFVALLVNKLIAHASSISPWGYELEEQSTAKPLA